MELLAGARLERRAGELGIEPGDLGDRLHAAGEHRADRPRGAGELLDRLLEGVRFLVERVLSVLELLLRRVGPVGDRLCRLLTLRRVGDARIVDAHDQGVRRLDRPLEALANESRSSLRGLGLWLLAARRRLCVGIPHVVDDVLELAPPDADRAADALRPLARGNHLAAVVTASDRGTDDDHGDDADGGENPGKRPAHV